MMDSADELEKELAASRVTRVPSSVKSHWKGCKSCRWQFVECKDGSLYRAQISKLARSPCASWTGSGL
ncbi:MAG TPA: hypothetical protein VFI08_09805, partial [Spirochaetia bacterium]|nr:hypothetical protein [Spirochaetia bacterium]